jgi:hypothetical protein
MSGEKVDERYPIGKFVYEKKTDDKQRNLFVLEIELAPLNLREAIKGLSENQIDTPYREGGWTLRQVVHHLPDSHINAFVRFKLALTEDNPTVKTYDEKKWAELRDYSNTPIDVSLNLFDNLHKRWNILIKSMKPDDFQKSYVHPELGKVDLDWVLAQYAWHGKHHVAHITSLRKRNGW